MIRLTSPNSSGSTAHYLAPQAIARITEAGASSQWHGIRSIVRTFDGEVLECSETAREINAAIEHAHAITSKEGGAA